MALFLKLHSSSTEEYLEQKVIIQKKVCSFNHIWTVSKKLRTVRIKIGTVFRTKFYVYTCTEDHLGESRQNQTSRMKQSFFTNVGKRAWRFWKLAQNLSEKCSNNWRKVVRTVVKTAFYLKKWSFWTEKILSNFFFNKSGLRAEKVLLWQILFSELLSKTQTPFPEHLFDFFLEQFSDFLGQFEFWVRNVWKVIAKLHSKCTDEYFEQILVFEKQFYCFSNEFWTLGKKKKSDSCGDKSKHSFRNWILQRIISTKNKLLEKKQFFPALSDFVRHIFGVWQKLLAQLLKLISKSSENLPVETEVTRRKFFFEFFLGLRLETDLLFEHNFPSRVQRTILAEADKIKLHEWNNFFYQCWKSSVKILEIGANSERKVFRQLPEKCRHGCQKCFLHIEMIILNRRNFIKTFFQQFRT